MSCPTCRGPQRHTCPTCERRLLPPRLGGDPLEQCEPCPHCVACRRPYAGPLPLRPVPRGRIAATAAALHRDGVSLSDQARILYGEDTYETRRRAYRAARRGLLS